jgi:beta-galactosidase
MYPDVKRMIRLADREDEDRPVILCEYSHSMGNSNGNLHLYWKEFWNTSIPRLQGGFIWDMNDQAIRVKNSNGEEFFAYGGDFGDLIHDAQFCLNVSVRHG